MSLKETIEMMGKPKKEQPEEIYQPTIDNALDFVKKVWWKLLNDIVKNPSPPGLYKKELCDDTWDLRRFEKYLHDTFSLASLGDVLDYKEAKIHSDTKGYTKFETPRR